MNRERLIQLADYLYALPQERFIFTDVCIFESDRDKECMRLKHYEEMSLRLSQLQELRFDCGSVGCAMGHTPNIWPELVRCGYYTIMMRHEHCFGFISVACKLFEISEYHAETLFTSRYKLPETASPSQVADAIMTFVRTNN